jgi:hypothetical protein
MLKHGRENATDALGRVACGWRQTSSRNRKRIWSCGVLLLALFLFGCQPVGDRTIVGTFEAETPCVRVSIAFNGDHSFVVTTKTPEGETGQLKGKWSLELVDKDASLLNRALTPFSRVVRAEPFFDFSHDARGEQVPRALLKTESIGPSMHIGPDVIQCPDSRYEIDYIK